MKISRFFQEVLGANLKNTRWSWGATDPVNNYVFLRLWQDQIHTDHDGQKVEVYWKKSGGHSAGYRERLEHIQAIKKGAQGFGILCRAVNPHPDGPRTILDFDESPVLILGEFSEDDKYIYANIVGKTSTRDLARVRTGQSTLTKDIKAIISSKAPDFTTKEALIEARVGQGGFRSAVLQLWGHKCSVTGSVTGDAIRASHIKPWRDCTNAERLDPKNGLPLTANLDALFDAGLISFDESGEMLVSPKLSKKEREIYGVIRRSLSIMPSAETAEYLRYHNTKIYQK